MSTPAALNDIARAFSGHKFEEVFDRLADDVRWILPGQVVLEGSDAVIAACRGTLADLNGTTTSWKRFVSVAGTDVVAVDAVGRYVDEDGVSAVSSCDIYEFANDKIVTITSYAVEVDPDNVGAAPS